MSTFSDAAKMFRLQRDAKRIRRELKHVHVEAEAQGVKVIVSGEMELVDLKISPETSRESIAPLLKDALNRAMKKAQVVSAERMQGLMGEMGMPGMGVGE